MGLTELARPLDGVRASTRAPVPLVGLGPHALFLTILARPIPAVRMHIAPIPALEATHVLAIQDILVLEPRVLVR